MDFKGKNKIQTEFSMASMSDLIFLLLIFFVLTSSVVSPNVLKLFLPNSSSKTIAKQSISVSITSNIEYFVNSEMVTLETLSQKIISEAKGEKEPTIVLNTDKTVPIEYVVKVMDIANNLKYKLVLATNAQKTELSSNN